MVIIIILLLPGKPATEARLEERAAGTPGDDTAPEATALPSLPPLPVLAGTPLPLSGAVIEPSNVDQLDWLATWGRDIISNGCFSPDGSRLAVSTTTSLTVYDAASLSEVFSLPVNELRLAFPVFFSPDGAELRAVSWDLMGRDELAFVTLDAASGAERARVPLGVTYYLDFKGITPDGSLMARMLDGELAVVDVASGETRFTLRRSSSLSEVMSTQFSPDGRFYTYSEDKLVHLVDVAQGKRIISNQGTIGSFSSDSAYWITHDGDDPANVIVMRLSDFIYKELALDNICFLRTADLALGGELLVTASACGEVALWDVASGKKVKSLLETDGEVGYTDDDARAVFSPDGSRLLVAQSKIGRGALYQAPEWQPAGELPGFTPRNSAVALSPDGTRLAQASIDCNVTLRRVSDGSSLWTTGIESCGVRQLFFSPDGSQILLNTIAQIQVLRASDGAVTRSIDLELGYSRSLDVSSDWSRIVALGRQNQLYLLDTASLQILKTLPPLENPRAGGRVLFSPDGRYFAAVHSEDQAYLYETASGEALYGFDYGSLITELEFSPDGSLLAMASSGDTDPRVIQTSDGSLVYTLEGHLPDSYGRQGVDSLVFSPDGSQIATGGRDGTARLWRASDGSLLQTLTLPLREENVYQVLFSPDGRLLFTHSMYNHTSIWSLADGRLLGTLNGLWHELDISRDGALIYGTSVFDATVNVLGIPAGAPVNAPVMLATAPPEMQAPTPPPRPEGRAGDTRVREFDSMTEVYVPPGEFIMGANYSEDEKPVHTVYLDGFWIDQTEVTHEMFANFLTEMTNQVEGGEPWYDSENNSNLISQDGDDWVVGSRYKQHPVVQVTWYGARAYCQWAGADLPTEAQWEKAARGSDGRTWVWGDAQPDCSLANYGECLEYTAPVGSYPRGASPYGALDLAGNVWEWVADWYGDTYYASQTEWTNPLGPASGDKKVLKGGSWAKNGGQLVPGKRHKFTPEVSTDDIGFRCARPD